MMTAYARCNGSFERRKNDDAEGESDSHGDGFGDGDMVIVTNHLLIAALKTLQT